MKNPKIAQNKKDELLLRQEFKKLSNKVVARCKNVDERNRVLLERDYYIKNPNAGLPNRHLTHTDTIAAYNLAIEETTPRSIHEY
jgi:hypothetical protein